MKVVFVFSGLDLVLGGHELVLGLAALAQGLEGLIIIGLLLRGQRLDGKLLKIGVSNSYFDLYETICLPSI